MLRRIYDIKYAMMLFSLIRLLLIGPLFATEFPVGMELAVAAVPASETQLPAETVLVTVAPSAFPPAGTLL